MHRLRWSRYKPLYRLTISRYRVIPTPHISRCKWRRYNFIPTNISIPTDSSMLLISYTDQWFTEIVYLDLNKIWSISNYRFHIEHQRLHHQETCIHHIHENDSNSRSIHLPYCSRLFFDITTYNTFEQKFIAALTDELTISSFSSREKITLQGKDRPNILQ
jgi:hypothetical protein